MKKKEEKRENERRGFHPFFFHPWIIIAEGKRRGKLLQFITRRSTHNHPSITTPTPLFLPIANPINPPDKVKDKNKREDERQ